MKPVIRRFLWLSMLLVLGMACYLGDVHAQEPPGQGGMGERGGQMT